MHHHDRSIRPEAPRFIVSPAGQPLHALLAALVLVGSPTALGLGNPACPNPAHDCLTSGTPGCSDEGCCNQICALDPFCCDTWWDNLCVGEAESQCALGPVCNDCCPTDLNLDGVTGGADLGLLLACWGIVQPGCECADLDGGGTVDGADLGLMLANWGACPSPESCICAASDHDCCTSGDAGCSDLKCCEAICAVDGFCCEFGWDAICVGEAKSVCGFDCVTCPPSDHDCCTTGGPGCTDVQCCEAVCLADSFCCTVAWDGVCVDAVGSACAILCGGCPASDHDCLTAGGPGCTDVPCCDAVCAVDIFCCIIAWDGACVLEAQSLCGVPECPIECPEDAVPEPEPCGADTDGGCNLVVVGDSSCCFEQVGPGCDDPACQSAVCAVDPFCCEFAWDGICAGEALSLCPTVCMFGAPSFAAIVCGQPICGTAWAEGGTRDTDWYQIEIAETTEIALVVETTLPLVIGIVDTGGVPDCALANFLDPFDVAGFCGEGVVTACLEPGTWWIFAAPDVLAGLPCGGVNEYVLRMECNVPPLSEVGAKDLMDEAIAKTNEALGPLNKLAFRISLMLEEVVSAQGELQLASDQLAVAISASAACGGCAASAQATMQDGMSAVEAASAGLATIEEDAQFADGIVSDVAESVGEVTIQMRDIQKQTECARRQDKLRRIVDKTSDQRDDLEWVRELVVEASTEALAALEDVDGASAATQTAVAQLVPCGTCAMSALSALASVDVALTEAAGLIAAIELEALTIDELIDETLELIRMAGSLATRAVAGYCGCVECGDAEHDCFTTGTATCSDVACCELVCATDPFCCDVAWDAICVDEAFVLCAEPR